MHVARYLSCDRLRAPVNEILILHELIIYVYMTPFLVMYNVSEFN